jgi:very-short-patch-repair endonuclease
MIIKYRRELKQLARGLRRQSTKAEALLWSGLKGKQILGYRFNRQKPIGNYIVDFYCHELRLVVEIDGISHNEKLNSDQRRQNELEKLGFRVIRMYDDDVCQDANAAIRFIADWIERNK